MLYDDPHKTGMDRIFQDQALRNQKFEMDRADMVRGLNFRAQPKIPILPVSTESQLPSSYRLLPKFVFYLSFPFILVGLGAGYWLSAELFTGWSLLAGTVAGGAVGFATPGLTYVLIVSLLKFLSEVLKLVFALAFMAALLLGAYVALVHFYG